MFNLTNLFLDFKHHKIIILQIRNKNAKYVRKEIITLKVAKEAAIKRIIMNNKITKGVVTKYKITFLSLLFFPILELQGKQKI